MKHRTQILLDPSQYGFLRSLSQKEGVSLGELVRKFIEEKRQMLLQRHQKDPFKKLIGSLEDEECTSENFKEFLYRKENR